MDWVPVVGLVMTSERWRRANGESVLHTYLPLTRLLSKEARLDEIEILKYMGTKNWPKPEDRTAGLRANAMAARNMLFAAYHVMVPGTAWIYGPRIATAVAEHLPNLPLP